MLIDFNAMQEITVPGMNNGTGTIIAKMYMNKQVKIIPCSIYAAILSVCISTKPAMI